MAVPDVIPGRCSKPSPIRIEVVRKADNQVGFAVIGRRWVVERFFCLDQPEPTTGPGLRGRHRER
jgi:hypothetical protein